MKKLIFLLIPLLLIGWKGAPWGDTSLEGDFEVTGSLKITDDLWVVDSTLLGDALVCSTDVKVIDDIWCVDTMFAGGVFVDSGTALIIGDVSAGDDVYITDTTFHGDAIICSTTAKVIGTSEFDATMTYTNSTAGADTALYIKHYGSRTTDYGIVIDMDTLANTAGNVIGIGMSGSNAIDGASDYYFYGSATNYWNGAGAIQCNGSITTGSNVIVGGSGGIYPSVDSAGYSGFFNRRWLNGFYITMKIDGETNLGNAITDTVTTTGIQEVAGGYKNRTLAASIDSVNVGGYSVVGVNTAGGNITIGGFNGGVVGQVIYLYNSSTNNVIIEDDEGGGYQDIKTPTAADITITAEGGATLVCNGTLWYIIGIAQ